MNELALIFATVTSSLSLPTGLLASVCYVETKHTPSTLTVSDKGSPSYGICQIKLKTARSLGFKGSATTLLNNQRTNILYAGKYLQWQHRRYHSWVRAVSAYNRGHSDQLKFNPYVQKVFAHWGGGK